MLCGPVSPLLHPPPPGTTPLPQLTPHRHHQHLYSITINHKLVSVTTKLKCMVLRGSVSCKLPTPPPPPPLLHHS
ncbi:hypothetical protein E2C01_004496 [Portunus trituberculatus]|uniref:Uncharacterized protein n=1 Tax=Portunus trituberculatus TaxID=210409 RepID=A0A5B7CSH5_PORTR|nr:hypothetical protein [Portunus trituberculatus]